jgi:hypothetical protein
MVASKLLSSWEYRKPLITKPFVFKGRKLCGSFDSIIYTMAQKELCIRQTEMVGLQNPTRRNSACLLALPLWAFLSQKSHNFSDTANSLSQTSKNRSSVRQWWFLLCVSARPVPSGRPMACLSSHKKWCELAHSHALMIVRNGNSSRADWFSSGCSTS